MAPLQFTLSYGDDPPLEIVAAVVPAKTLVVVVDPGAWAYLARDLPFRGRTSTVVAGRVREQRFAVLDLRHFASAADVPPVSDVPGEAVAVHHTRDWDFNPVVHALRAQGRPVVLFAAKHTEVTGLDLDSALIGRGVWGGVVTVVGMAVGHGTASVEDVEWQFAEWARAEWARYNPWQTPPTFAPAFAPARLESPDPLLPPVRPVNVLVRHSGSPDVVTGPLRPGARYDVVVGIGPRDADSLLDEGGRWPDENLAGDLALRAVLSMDGDRVWMRHFTLHAVGSSVPSRFPVVAPDSVPTWTGDLVIYHGSVPVHAQRLSLPVGEGDGPSALPLHRLSATFADIGPLADRTASIVVSGGEALLYADKNATRVGVHFDAAVRPLLRGCSAGLDPWYGKDFEAFCADLAALARQGAVLHERMFGGSGLPELIRRDAAARGRPAVFSVLDPAFSDPLPWSLVYDLPFTDGPHRLCASLRWFGSGGGAVPPHCPEPDHSGNVLCPFGFWGLSSVVEQLAGPLVWHLDGRPQVLLAADPALDRVRTQQHAAELVSLLPPESVTTTFVGSPAELAQALVDETANVAYLYCGGGLSVGDVSGWPRRESLVLLNACETDPEPGFVGAVVNSGAAGVISTEVPVDQGVAGWAAGLLLSRFVAGASAGEAVRQMRWDMLARGNVLGLAYTLHAAADLRFR